MNNNSRGFIHPIILLILVFAVLAGIGYFALNKSPNNSNQIACTLEAKICPDGSSVGRAGPNCEFAPCPTEKISDQTENWKTYKSEKYGFEVKYYPELQPNEHVGTEEVGQFTYLLNVNFGTVPLKSQHGFILEVNKGNSLAEWETDLIGHNTDKIDSVQEITINNQVWTKMNYLIFVTTEEVPITTAFTNYRKLGYAITSSKLDIDQILSTFKFLDQAVGKRTIDVIKSDRTKTTIDLNSAKKFPQGLVFDDISSSWIEKVILSPDESKIAVVTWNGGSDVYVVLLALLTNPTALQEIGLNDVSLLNNIVWSGNSRYVTTVSRPANIGPYRIEVWDTQTNNRASIKEPTGLLKDSCASLSLHNPKWTSNSSLQATYEAYYFVSDETCQPDPSIPIQKGTTTLYLE
ncbi:hypothetical protein A2627_05495 [Candidatus Woesebacteria bacterium RIFCSPHIGHO2_01_FULL_39_28]|uniref:Uncharacterized protein n=1 Tax=Candidatus Woesebacteria bacterium RIFCSPHIGHO2_01_FULL_39_28 TaxID=1802496 RepID=A0A1F7YBV5_9BACT|nr:MAG: hypothetical protein A2627_05495 [Candidatus Woesebacteria bacterium RIFCSPHIGHO2_01_FULL_39_28]